MPATSKVGPCDRKRMRTFHVQTAFRDGSDMEMAYATAQDAGVVECALLSTLEMEAAYALVGGAREKVRGIFDIGLEYVLDRYDDMTAGCWMGVDLFCTDPPHNVQSIPSRSNSDYDVFSNTYIENMAHLIWGVRKNGGHGHIFCSELQFGWWYKQVRKVTESAHSSDENDGEAATRTVPLFEVEKVALKHNRATGHFIWNTGFSKLLHTNVSESAVHCWRLRI